MSANVNSGEKTVINNVSANIKAPVINDILKSQFTNPNLKISNEAVELMTELARQITVEAALRAAKQAVLRNEKNVSLEHTESIIPQMMLDFP